MSRPLGLAVFHNPHKIAIPFIALASAIAVFNITANVAGAAQRTIAVDRQTKDEPVTIKEVTVGTMSIQCGLPAGAMEDQPIVPFEAGNDWLQDTTLYLVNRTNKNIVFAQIAIVFPETGDGSPQRPTSAVQIPLGRIPESVAYTGSGKPLTQSPKQLPMLFAPGQTLSVKLGDYLAELKASVINIPFESVSKIKVSVISIIFDDAMKWDGHFYTPDPQNRGKWVRVPGRYFPGHPFWPPK